MLVRHLPYLFPIGIVKPVLAVSFGGNFCHLTCWGQKAPSPSLPDTRAMVAEIQLICSDLIYSLSIRNYRAASALVPAAAKTASASCSAIGMNVWTTSVSNCVFELSTKRRMASACGKPLR